MGVVRALFDPISFNLLRQSVDRHTDALWREDGGRDGQPNTRRTPQQRCCDAIFELLTGKPAPAHKPTAGDTPHRAQGGRSSRQTPRGHSDRQTQKGHSNRRAQPGHSTSQPPAGHPSRQQQPGHPDRQQQPRHPDRGAQPGHPDQQPQAEHPDRQAQPEHPDRSPAPGELSQDNGSPDGDYQWIRAKDAAQLVVIADIGVLDGTNPDGRCEILGTGPVPPDILAELSPDTELSSIIFGGNGQPLWLRRSKRLANDHQRLAVAVRDGGCVLCEAPMHLCEIHHVREWNTEGGATDVENLAAICGHHHRWLHNNNQQLTYSPEDRNWTTQTRPPPPSPPPQRLPLPRRLPRGDTPGNSRYRISRPTPPPRRRRPHNGHHQQNDPHPN